MGFFQRLFGGGKPKGQEPTRGPSLPLDLARRGWVPHKFPDSNVVVFLPQGIGAAHDPEGVLFGSTTGKGVEFSATLHRDFDEERAGALNFVAHMAEERGLKVQEVGTYNFFYDPTDADRKARTMRFWVVGIPGSVVVLSILCQGEKPVSPLLEEVRREIPHVVGELL